jgi:hypothetical protein
MASEIANSSSEIVIGTRRSLRHQFFFGGRAGACLISLGPLGFEGEETVLTAVATGGFETPFCMAQKMSALKSFAAMEIALPRLSSLVASCKISKSSVIRELRIKIQTKIVSLRLRPEGRFFYVSAL